MSELTPLVKFSLEIIMTFYLVSGAMLVLRVVKGPTVFDRVLAIDALSYDLTVFMALIALYTGRYMLAGSMVPLALWAYSLDLYVSWYVRRVRMGG